MPVIARFYGIVVKMYFIQSEHGVPQFGLLKTPAFFRAVRVDPGGYGISWNDAMDLSEYELWTNGKPVEGSP